MGIEPTNHNSHCGPAGFEDQARHQTGSTSLVGGLYHPPEEDLDERVYYGGLYGRKTTSNPITQKSDAVSATILLFFRQLS